MKVCISLSIHDGEEKSGAVVTMPTGEKHMLDAEHGCHWVDLNDNPAITIEAVAVAIVEAAPVEAAAIEAAVEEEEPYSMP